MAEDRHLDRKSTITTRKASTCWWRNAGRKTRTTDPHLTSLSRDSKQYSGILVNVIYGIAVIQIQEAGEPYLREMDSRGQV